MPIPDYNNLKGLDWKRVDLCQLTCPSCQVSFDTQSEFGVHSPCYKQQFPLLVHEGADKRYECKDCGHRTRTITTLLDHVRSVHVQEKTFKCNHCHTCFTAKQNLFKHMQQVHYSSPCLVRGCQLRFNSRPKLITHLQELHAGVSVTECQNCRKLLQTDGMRRHILTCPGVLPNDAWDANAGARE